MPITQRPLAVRAGDLVALGWAASVMAVALGFKRSESKNDSPVSTEPWPGPNIPSGASAGTIDKSAKSSIGYMPQLDGLRALAVAAVLVTHLVPKAPAANSWGYYGVRLFFVLSGFLITGILLRCRADRAEISGDHFQDDRIGGCWYAARQFYVRRMLRIFPIFYLSLLLAAAINLPAVRTTFFWDAAYLTNFRSMLFGKTHGAVDHLWSLSVEEQFYLVWPWVVLWVPRRWVGRLMAALIALGPVSRAFVYFMTMDRERNMYPLFSCLDTLAGGAALAYLADAGLLVAAGRWLRRAAPPAALLLLASYALPTGGAAEAIHLSLRDLLAAVAAAAVIATAANGDGIANPLGRLLACGPMRYLGRISYGIYLYHFYLKYLLPQIVHRMIGRSLSPWADAALTALATFAVAAASWHLLESPLNRLKQYFDYRPAPWRRPTSPASPASPPILRPAA
jgi:peptidoglycan/LPS O-acetylase OafA/YrhL